MNYGDQMREIVERYRHAGEEWPATMRMVASWAVTKRLWQPQPSSLLDQCADHLSRALREDYITDPQGRRVRAKHAATFKSAHEQQTFWADIRNASHEHMELAFQQRRRGIVADCTQLKSDVDSYNENNSNDATFQLSLNFTYDVEEIELSKELVA